MSDDTDTDIDDRLEGDMPEAQFDEILRGGGEVSNWPPGMWTSYASALIDQRIDRNSGEIMAGKLSDFEIFEVGAFDKSLPQGFRRNTIARGLHELSRWRMRYDNTGVFRTVLASNFPGFLAAFDDAETLQYGDLCFDMDAPKEMEGESWTELIVEIEDKLVPRLIHDFELERSDIRFWFSGGRGMHVEVPAAAIGVWPEHNLHRIFGYYALEIKRELNLTFLDPSLYGAKHLYRLEYSRHQRTGLTKFPLQFRELAGVRDDFRWMEKFATSPRAAGADSLADLYTFPQKPSRALSFYATLAKEALNVQRPTGQLGAIADRDRSKYDRHRFWCIETMMSDGYLLPEGARNTMALAFARHLRDGGFSYEEAEAEFEVWAADHCDPPMTTPAERAEWQRILQREYNNDKNLGCTYIQSNIPSLCQEKLCPIGQNRIRRRQQAR